MKNNSLAGHFRPPQAHPLSPLAILAALILLLTATTRSMAQVPSPAAGVLQDAQKNWIPVLKGEASLAYATKDPLEPLTCGPASENAGHVYPLHDEKHQLFLKFSFGKPGSGPAIGSWVIYEVWPGYHEDGVLYAGVFTAGTPNAALNPRGKRSIFRLEGTAIVIRPSAQKICGAAGKNLRIEMTGATQPGAGSGVVFRIYSGGRLYASATFKKDVRVLLTRSPASDVDRTLHTRTPGKKK